MTAGPADRVRNAPLPAVAELLGYRRDPRDRRRWRRPGSIISISGARFYDHLQGRGGGGAIDLAVHALGCSPGEAIRRLDGPDLPPPPDHAAGANPQTPPFRPPPPCEAHWPQVRSWLCGRRRLEPGLVDLCHETGILGADRRRNAVFLCRSGTGRPAGAELVGTGSRRWRGMSPGSRKADGGFWLQADPRTPQRLVIAESAIDALSAFLLAEPEQAPTAFLSAAGAAPKLPDWTRAWSPELILCGCDADEAGDDAARRLIDSDQRAVRLRPEGAKDWNDLLRLQARHAEPTADRALIPNSA